MSRRFSRAVHPKGVDARGIQPFYTGLLARMSGMALTISLLDEVFSFPATPADKPAAIADAVSPAAGSEPFSATDQTSA